MQSIDVYSNNLETAATNLKNALTQYASGYFDSFETDFTDADGEKVVQCKIGETVVVEIVYKNQSGYLRLRGNGMQLAHSYGVIYIISRIDVCENAIRLCYGRQDAQFNLAENVPLLLCKKKNGDTAFAFFANQGATSISAPSAGGNYVYVLSISRSTGATDFSMLPTYVMNNNAGSVSGYSLFSFNDGNLLKDVFLVVDSDFRSHVAPFTYTLNNVTYTGFAGNYLAVKGT